MRACVCVYRLRSVMVRVGGRRGRAGGGRRAGRRQSSLYLLLLLQRSDEGRLQPGRVLRLVERKCYNISFITKSIAAHVVYRARVYLERPLDVPGDAELAQPARRVRVRRREGGVLPAGGRALPAPHGREVAAALRAHRRHRRPRHPGARTRTYTDGALIEHQSNGTKQISDTVWYEILFRFTR